MKCEHASPDEDGFIKCGFIDWLRQYRPQVVLNEGICPKTEDLCLRLFPYQIIGIETFGLVTYEETEIANPPTWTDESGRERRL